MYYYWKINNQTVSGWLFSVEHKDAIDLIEDHWMVSSFAYGRDN